MADIGSVENFRRDSLMRDELARLLNTPELRRAPVLTRLLQYLVSETIAGRGRTLKAYTVAVEGLGRESDFDALSDSYPRVQVGRLRKLLEAHYAKFPLAGSSHLVIEPGSYRVRVVSLGSAALSSASSPATETGFVSAVQRASASAPPVVGRFRLSWKWLFLGILLIAILAAVVLTVSRRQSTKIVGDAVLKTPILVLRPVNAFRSDAQTTRVAQLAYAVMADGMSRSWTARLQTGTPSVGTSDGAIYELTPQLVKTGTNSNRLFLRLIEGRTHTVIWSTTVTLSDDPGKVETELAPSIANLMGAFGVIVTTEFRRNQTTFTPGYACMLQYIAFERNHEARQRDRVLKCMPEPVTETRLKAVVLTARAFLALDPSTTGYEKVAAMTRATELANEAVANSPEDAFARFAIARINYLNNDCVTGKRNTLKAVALNPYDPVLVAVLGGLMYQCGDDEALPLIERAFLIRPEGSSYGRLPLALALIVQGKTDQMEILADAHEIGGEKNSAYAQLCDALVFAGLGDRNAAVKSWAKFMVAQPSKDASADTALRNYIFSDGLRAGALKLLTDRNIVG